MNKELKALQGMKQLKLFPAYLRLINELELKVQDLDVEIIESFWEWEMKYTALDLKRVERMTIKLFMELPDNIINSFDNIVEVDEKDLTEE